MACCSAGASSSIRLWSATSCGSFAIALSTTHATDITTKRNVDRSD